MPNTMTLIFRQAVLDWAAANLLLWISLIDENGDEITGGDPAAARKAVTWDPADAEGILYPVDSILFDVPGGDTIVAGWKAWDTETIGTGNDWGNAEIVPNRTFSAQGTFLLVKADSGLKAI